MIDNFVIVLGFLFDNSNLKLRHWIKPIIKHENIYILVCEHDTLIQHKMKSKNSINGQKD